MSDYEPIIFILGTLACMFALIIAVFWVIKKLEL